MVVNAHRKFFLGNQNLMTQEMNGAFENWLHYLKLAKYKWFFNCLSYLEIVLIDKDNIQSLIAKVNRICGNGNSIKMGAQERICTAVKELKFRPIKLGNLLWVNSIIV